MMKKSLKPAVRAISAMLLCGSLMGCFGSKEGACAKPREYQASRSVQSLEVPGDLDAPPNVGLDIPEVPPTEDGEAQAQQAQKCLDDPPDYFGR